MTIVFGILFLASLVVVVVFLSRNKKLEEQMLAHKAETQALLDQQRAEFEREIDGIKGSAQTSIAEALKATDQQLADFQREIERIKQHYEAESRKAQEAADALVARTIRDFEPLRKFEKFRDAETEAQRQLSDAIKEAAQLRADAQTLLQQTHIASAAEREEATLRVRDIREQADALLNQAIRDVGRIIASAEKRAEEIGGDAYVALRDKHLLEQAAEAMRNIVEGYGDRYIIPSHSLLDDLAAEFGYDSAGQALKSAKEHSRRMVGHGEAAACDYVEANRREIAVRFVIDAFNGRVEAILSRARKDNFGTLEQEIRDAYSLVNLNGQAFRNARILPAYLDSRLAELKWAVVVRELERRQKEEQRYMRDQMRDDERARKENEARIKQAAREQEIKAKAVQELEAKYASASAEQKAAYEQELSRVRQELAEATEKSLTIAQQTKKGHVYVISNIGSLGEGVYKIGHTRRLDPQERIDELSDASLPFEFDVHALIESENAPVLEHKIHKQFLEMQVNKMNSRKEFFRVTLADIRQEIEKLSKGDDFTVKTWTEKATATEYRESLDIDSDPQKRAKWLERQRTLADRQLRFDTLPVSLPVLPGGNGGSE